MSDIESYNDLCDYIVTRVVHYLNLDHETVCQKLKCNKKNIQFYADYGCCLVYSDVRGCFPCSVVSITLVALDKWQFNIEETTARRFDSICTNHAFLSAGRIKLNDKTAFDDALLKLLKKASSQKGHHRTPGFMLSVIQETIKIVNMKIDLPEKYEAHPLGGFTDVGMHTFLKQRKTEWPLAKAVLSYIIFTSIPEYNVSEKNCFSFYNNYMTMFIIIGW